MSDDVCCAKKMMMKIKGILVSLSMSATCVIQLKLKEKL